MNQKIFKAIEDNDIDEVSRLLDTDIDIQIRNELNYTLLDAAIISEHVEIARLLVDRNADVNAPDKYNCTPLHFAITKVNLQLVQLLLQSGADVHAKNAFLSQPLHIAVHVAQDQDIVKSLLERGSDVNAKDRHEMTPLLYAIYLNLTEIADMLLESGAKIDYEVEFWESAVTEAYDKTNNEMIYLLLENGAEVTKFLRVANRGSKIAPAGQRFVPAKDAILFAHTVKRYLCKEQLDDAEVAIISEAVGDPESEVDRLKGEVIVEEFDWTVYDVLTKDFRKLSRFLMRNGVLGTVKGYDYEREFPLYSDYINYRVRYALKKTVLRNRIYRLVRLLLNNIVEVPDVCIQQIFTNFNNYDLRIISDKCGSNND